MIVRSIYDKIGTSGIRAMSHFTHTQKKFLHNTSVYLCTLCGNYMLRLKAVRTKSLHYHDANGYCMTKKNDTTNPILMNVNEN